MATLRAPSPRYRTDDPAPTIHLQPDDLEILWHVYCNRVIDATSLVLLFPNRSQQSISRRLNLLRKGPRPYLHRLPQALNRLRYRNGSDPQVYALASAGALALRVHRGVDVPSSRWTQKNRELRASTIAHEVGTSRFMARLRRDASLAGGDVQMLYQQEFEPEGRKPAASQGGLKNTLRTQITNWPSYRGEQGTAPDRLFALSAGGRRHYFLLEWDEGTETIVPGEHVLKAPHFWRQSSLLRKFIIYASAFETKAHQDALGVPTFRVLTVTTSPSRLVGMQEACAQHLKQARPGLFLFGDWHQILGNASDLLSFAFEDHVRRPVTLTGSSRS